MQQLRNKPMVLLCPRRSLDDADPRPFAASDQALSPVSSFTCTLESSAADAQTLLRLSGEW